MTGLLSTRPHIHNGWMPSQLPKSDPRTFLAIRMAPAPPLRRAQRRRLTVSASFIRSVQSKLSLSMSCPNAPSSSNSQSRSGLPSQKSNGTLKSTHSWASSIQPIHRPKKLPSELLITILCFAAEKDATIALRCAQVCRRWRRTLLRAPVVWRCIQLDHRTELWKLYIRRAQARSLDIRIDESMANRQSGDWNHHVIQGIMQPTTSHAHSWRSLNVQLRTPVPFLWNAVLSPLCLPPPHDAMPALEEVVLDFPMNDDCKHFGLFTPQLRRATINGIRLLWMSSVFRNLCYLDYTHHRFSHGMEAISEIMMVLEACPSLKELRLCVDGGLRRIPSSHIRTSTEIPQVHLYGLRILHLIVGGTIIPPELPHILANMYHPKLQALHLRHTSTHADRTVRPFPNGDQVVAMMRDKAHVRFLEVEDGWAHHRTVAAVAQVATRLEEVAIIIAGRLGQQVHRPIRRDTNWSDMNHVCLSLGSQSEYT